MAKFSSKIISSTPETFKTSVKIYDQSKLSSWQYANKSALDILNEYQEKIKRGDWLSTEDRAKYKSAIDSYTSSGNALREASRFYGTKYTADEEKSWNDSLSSLGSHYADVDKFYGQFADDSAYGKWQNLQNLSSVTGAEDYGSKSAYVGGGDDYTYNFINGQQGEGYKISPTKLDYSGFAVKDMKTESQARGYDLMTDEEIGIYNYYYNTQGKNKADEYLSLLEDDLVLRKAGNEYNAIKDKSGFAKILYGLGAGAEQGLAGISNFESLIKGEEGFTPSSQYVSANVRNELGKEGQNLTFAQVLYDLANSTGNMLPSMAIGAMTGGVGGAVTMGLSSAGNSYSQLLEEGYGVDRARAYGLLTGAAEGGLSYALGGISKLGGKVSGKFIKNAVDGIDNGIARFLASTALNMGSEGLEEGIQTALEPVFKAITTGEELEAATWSDMAYSSLLGAVSAGVLEGVPGAVKTAFDVGYAKSAIGNNVQGLTAEAIELNPNSKVAQMSKERLAQGKAVSASAIYSMLTNNERTYVKQDTSKIRSAAESRLTELGETGDVSAIADVIARQTAGEDISFKDKNIVKGSKFAERVANELNRENIQSGQYSSAWAEGIGTKRVNADVYNKGISESQRLVAKAAQEMTSRVKGFTAEAASAMVKGYDGTQNPSEYIKNFKNSFEIGRDRGELSGETNSAMKVAYVIGQTEAERVANLSESEASREHLAEFSKKYGDQAQAAIDAYENGQDVVEYESGYDRAFEKAKSGLDFSYIESSEDTAYLTEAQKKAAYEAGIKYADSVARQQAENITTQTAENTVRRKGAVKGEGVKISDLRKAFNDTQNRAYKVLSRIAEATGIDIVLYKSEVDANGNYRGAQGKFKWSNDKIYIDLNAGLNNVKDTGSLANYTMLRTFSHEFSHFIEKHDPMMYNELRRTVFSELTARGSNVEALIAAKQGDMDIDNASREVVAEALTDILPDSHFVEILAQKNPSALKKISTKLKEFVSNVKSYFASIKPNSAIEAKALKEERDGVVRYVQSIIDAFDKAAVSAVENYQRTKADSNSTTSNDKIQEQRRKVPPRDEFATNAMIWAHSDRTEVGEKKLFYRKGKWVLLEKTDNGFVEMGTYTDKQRNEILKEIEVYNETIREDLYTCIMRHEAVGRNDMRDYGDDGRKQAGDGRGGSIHQGESNSDRSGSNESGESGNRNQVDEEQHQEREEFSLDNRSLLVNALDSVAQNPMESKKLSEYRANIKGLNEQSEKLVELKSELKELSFSKGPRDMARIKELRAEIVKTENRINLYDKRLLNLEATRALRDVITRETQKAYKKAEQKGKEALKVQRERSEARLAETKKQYQESRARATEGRHKTEIRHKIKGLKGKFIFMLEHPTERQYVPADLVSAMVEVCKLVDTDAPLYKADGSVNKAQQARNEQMQRLFKLSDEYKALKNNPDPMYSGEYDEEIQEYLDDLRREFSGKPISEMTLGELNELYQTMRAVEETLRDARRLIGWGEADLVYDAGDKIIAEQKDITVKRKGKGENSTKAKFIDLSLSPLRNVKRMANYKKGSPLVKMFRELELGVRNKNKFVMEAHKSFEELTSGSNAKKYEDAVYKPFGKEYVDKEGRKFHVSKMQMMQAIMSYNRELENDKLHHVSDGGFTFADLDMLNKGKLMDAIDAKNAHSITIGALLAEQFKAELANDKWAQDYMAASEYFFDVMAKNAINNTNMVLKHRLVATGKKYIPYEVNKDYVVREITSENDIQQTISGYGMLKDIKAGATQPLIITGLNNVLERHIEQVGNIYGLAVPIRNFNKVWNVKSSDGMTTVQEAIGRNWGNTGKSVMTQAVKDVQGARIDRQSELYKKVKGNVISSTFMLNGSVVAKQIGSMFSATSMLRWRDPVRMIANLGYTMANHKKIAAEVDKYTATAWMRRQGLSDAELHTLTTEAKKKGLGRLVSKLPTAINPTKWIAGMDSMVALSLWKYAKQDVAKRTGLKGEALLEATAEFYDDVIEHTQSMTDSLHRPEIQKRKDVVSDILGTFKTDLYQGAGQLQDALGECKADPSKENKAALARTVYANVMSACWGSLMTTVFALLRYKVNRYRDDEDDEIYAESWLKVQGVDLVADLVAYAVPLVGGEAAGAFFALMNGEKPDSVDNLTLTAVQDLIDAITAVANSARDGELPTEAAFNKILTKAGAVLGIPVNNITRLIEAIKLHAEDFANGELGSFEAGLTKPNATRLYNAYIEGDAEKIERASRLYADQKAIDTALRKALRDNDPRLEEAALARLEGDTDTYWDLFIDVVEEGKFKDELIKVAFEAEYNYHKTKSDEAKARGEEYP